MRSIVLFWLGLVLQTSLCFSALGATTPLTLDQVFQSAAAKNERVQQSAEQVVQADERISRVKGGILPDIALNAYHLIQPEPDDPIAREFSPGQQTTANFTLRQPIFRGLREFAGLRQQKQIKASQEALQRQTLRQLYQEVASSYLQVLSLEQDLINLREQLELYEKRVQDIKSRTQRGESSSSELLSTQSVYNSLQAERRLVQGQLRVAREALQSLTGIERDAPIQDPELVSRSAVSQNKKRLGDLESYLSSVEQRPDIQAVAAQRNAADEGITIARGAHYPVIDAVANYYLKRPGFLSDTKWDVSVQFSLPIFSGGATQAQVRESISKNHEAELELARTRRLANDEIQSLYETVSARLEHLTLLNESVELARKNVAVSHDEFRKGLIRSIDAQLALSEYRVIRRTLDQAYFTTQIDFIRLEIASGKRQGITQ